MRDLDQAFEQALRDDPTTVGLLRLSGGQIVTDEVWALTIEHATHFLGVDADRLLSTPYGLVPLPMPASGLTDSRLRVWPEVPLRTAAHPVFWLPERTVRQRPNEAADEWAVRLWLELVDRDLWDLEGDQPYDVFLVELGEPHTHPLLVEDLADYLAGEPVGWLDRFETSDGEIGSDALTVAAKRLVARCRQVYDEVKSAQRDHAEQLERQAVATLSSPPVDLLRHVASQVERYAQGDGDPSVVAVAAEQALAALAHADDARMVLTRAVEWARAGRFQQPIDTVVTAMREAAAARHHRFDPLVAGLFRNADPTSVDAFAGSIRSLWDRIADEGLAAAAALEELRRSGPGRLGLSAGGYDDG